MDVLDLLYKVGLVPVVTIDKQEDAPYLAKALLKGGLPVAEITLRTPAALESIKTMTQTYPEMCIGAGTVSTIREVEEATYAGANFIVTPGFNPDLVEYCVKKDILIIPGCATASEVQMALSFGLTTVKFFPAEANGGIDLIKSLSGPYPHVRFMPTGGINPDNLDKYLSLNQVIACGGSWMVDKSLIKNKQFDEIEMKTKQAVKKLLGFSLYDIKKLEETSIDSIFPLLESMLSIDMTKNLGNYDESLYNDVSNNYIFIKTNNIVRAKYHLENRGIVFDEYSKKYQEDNRFSFIALRDKVGDFNIGLVE